MKIGSIFYAYTNTQSFFSLMSKSIERPFYAAVITGHPRLQFRSETADRPRRLNDCNAPKIAYRAPTPKAKYRVVVVAAVAVIFWSKFVSPKRRRRLPTAERRVRAIRRPAKNIDPTIRRRSFSCEKIVQRRMKPIQKQAVNKASHKRCYDAAVF